MLLGLGSLACLTACEPRRVVEPIKQPPARLTCAVEPPVPASLTDATVAAYIVALVSAGRDCRSQLAFVRDFYDGL